MKAAVMYEVGMPLVIEEVSLDPPGRGEVKVRIAATAICHSDVHYIRGDWAVRLPVVLGHESAGHVEAVGEGVTMVQPGDAVVISLLRSCGRCEFCLTGVPQHCNEPWALDSEFRIHNAQGEALTQGVRVGGFAEYAVVDQSQLARIPETMSLETASLLACGVITGYGAVVTTAQIEAGSTVVVIGAGGVGLNSVQGAALAGAGRIIAVDLLDNKLTAALEFGATDTVNAREEDPIETIAQLTNGRKADYVFVTVGSAPAIEQSFRMIHPAGTVVLVGMPDETMKVNVPVRQFVRHGYRLIGSFMGSTRLQLDIPRMIEHYERGNLMLDELITARYPLEEINEAIESMERGEALRNVIVF